MQSSPLISIIIVNYNSGDVLINVINSIKNQKHKNFELIIVDGNSTDQSIDLIKEHKKYINQFISEPDKGIYDAMNKGVKMAKGQWIHFLGADDLYHSNSVLSDVANRLKTSKADIVYGNVVKTPSQTLYDGSFNAFKMIYKNICHQAIFYNKRIFNQLGLFEIQYTVNADWEFNFKAVLTKGVKIDYIPITIAYFNERGVSGSNEDLAYETRRKEFLTQLPIWAKLCYRYRKTKIVKLISKLFLNFDYA